MRIISYISINNLLLALFILLTITILSPFLLLSFYSHPSADDFCIAVSFRDSGSYNFLGVVLDWYQQWNSRYFSISLIGLYSIYFDLVEHYHFIPLILFGGLLLSAYVFVKSIFNDANPMHVLVCSLLFCVVYIMTMPNVSEGFYWMTSAFMYQIGNILVMAALACMVRLGTTKFSNYYAITSGILIIAVIGSSELYVVFMIVAMTTIAIYLISTNKGRRGIWFFLFLITVIAALVMVLAPGNEARGQHFEARHQFLFSIAASAYYTGRWFLQWLWEPLIWLVTLLYLLWLPELLGRSRIAQKTSTPHLVIISSCCMIIIFGCFFVGFWAMGDILPERSLNSVYLIFLIGWFLFITSLANSVSHKHFASIIPSRNVVKYYISFLISIPIVAAMLSSPNFSVAYADILHRAPSYDDILEARYLTIAEAKKMNPNQIIEVSGITTTKHPKTIMFMDIRDDWNAFPNPCYAKYFKITGIKTVNKLPTK